MREVFVWEDAHQHEVTIVRFLQPFPMLASSDTDGNLFIWMTEEPFKCILQSSNTPRPMSTNTITDLDFHYIKEARNKKDEII